MNKRIPLIVFLGWHRQGHRLLLKVPSAADGDSGCCLVECMGFVMLNVVVVVVVLEGFMSIDEAGGGGASTVTGSSFAGEDDEDDDGSLFMLFMLLCLNCCRKGYWLSLHG